MGQSTDYERMLRRDLRSPAPVDPRPSRQPPQSARRHSRWALQLICAAQLMITLDITIVNTALPSIQRGLGFDGASIAWVIDAYTLTFGGLLLLGGRTADLIGRRTAFLIGIAVFGCASLAAGLVGTPGLLLATRALQGVGAAIAAPAGLSLLTSIYGSGPARQKAMAVFAAMGGVGISAGLLIGGPLTELASWRWVMLINVPIAVVLIVAAPRAIGWIAPIVQKLDLPGAITGTLSIGCLVYGVIRSGEEGLGDRAAIVAFAGFAVFTVVFVVIQKYAPAPLLPLGMLRHPTRAGAYLVAILLFAALYPAYAFLAVYAQDVLEYGPTRAGLAYLPIGFAVLAVSAVARKLVARAGLRSFVLLGTALVAGGTYWLAFLPQHGSYAVGLLPSVIAIGAGLGLAMVANTMAALTDVPPDQAGLASGLFSTSQQVGGTIGLALLVSMSTNVTEDKAHEWTQAHQALPAPAAMDAAVTDGIGSGFAVAALFAVGAFVVGAVLIGHGRSE